MKVLIVHNNYGKYSGEEAVVDKMATMFMDCGHEVCFYRQTSEGCRDSLSGKINGFLCGLYSRNGVKGMREVLQREKPDVVNVHNLYPFISPAALFECKRAGVPIIMTVHNFRLICPTGLFMRNGKPCEHCLERGNEWGCIWHNCEHSILKSVGYAARNAVARWTRVYMDCVDRFACITEFQRQKLVAAGFGIGRIVVIPNSIDVSEEKVEPTIGTYVAYLGRLSFEKGYDLLVEVAQRHPEISFRFAGTQREESNTDYPSNVEFVGYLKGEKLKGFIKGSRFLVMPSRCYEGFPMAILEAAQHGKSVIGPNHGGFMEIIGTGAEAIGKLFEPGQVDDLEKKITNLWMNPQECVRLGQMAFDKLKGRYSSEVVSKQWMQLLEEVKK